MINTLEQDFLIELKAEELLEIEGGRKIPLPGPWGWVASGVIWVVDNWDELSENFEEGYNDARS